MATVDVLRDVYFHIVSWSVMALAGVVYNISGVGFCVARSTVLGNAKASKCGTSECKDSHAFFCLSLNHDFNY